MTKHEDLEREARRVLEPLRYSPVAVSSSGEVEAGRAATVPRLAELIQAVPIERTKRLERQHTGRVLRYAVGGALSLAAGALLWLGNEPGVQAGASADGPRLTLLDGQLSQKGTPLTRGVTYAIDTLGRLHTTTQSGAKFTTNEGVNIDFAANSTADLSFTSATRRIALNRGKVQLSVPKLQRGTSLSVATPDAVVTVHGTRFSVEIADDTSCVRVSEGVVSVARGDSVERLTAGQESGCQAARPALAAAPPPATAEPNDAAMHVRAPVRASGTLTRENKLFRSALAAEQSGNLAQAKLLARRLLSRYPDSPMAPDARRILDRLQSKRTETSQGQ